MVETVGVSVSLTKFEDAELSTIYTAIHNSDLVEKLHQTEAHEFWLKAIAAVRQFCVETPVTGIFLTHNPQILTTSHQVNCLFTNHLTTWIFTPCSTALLTTKALPISNTHIVRLSEADSLESEWFCLLLTNTFNLLVVNSHLEHSCLFSLHPTPIQQALEILQQRIKQPHQSQLFAAQLQKYPLQIPSYQVMAKFGTLLLTQAASKELPIPEIQEVEIIKAITHEVKTPLTTIKILVHSLLKHKDSSVAIKTRLKQIEQECTEQIERFDLIFEAAQLAAYPIFLETTHLENIFEQNLERWQKQATRRQLSLSINIPEGLPAIISNFKLLSQVLNGLVDRLTRSLPQGSHIQIQSTAAGEHLKLQFQSQLESNSLNGELPMLKAVGQWLMFQPETGMLSLSLPITKTLFQALGGKLTVRLHPTQTSYDGEILTIFLPFARV